MKTKGAILWGIDQEWSVEEIEVGDPVAGEVQIRMETAGMCHSDHHIVTGATPMPGYPVMGGHEGAGVITKLGPNCPPTWPWATTSSCRSSPRVGVAPRASRATWRCATSVPDC